MLHYHPSRLFQIPSLFSRFNVISQSQHDAEMYRAPPPPPPPHAVTHGYSSLFLHRPNVTAIPDNDPEPMSFPPSSDSGGRVLAQEDFSWWSSCRPVEEQEEYKDMQMIKRLR